MKGDHKILLPSALFQEAIAGHLRAVMLPRISPERPTVGQIVRLELKHWHEPEPYLLARICHVQPLLLPQAFVELMQAGEEILSHLSEDDADVAAWLERHGELRDMMEGDEEQALHYVCGIKGGLSW